MVKKIKLLILCAIITCATYAQNRYATEADVALYGAFITPGDFIIDTPTKRHADNINQVRYANFSASFPKIREDANIWVDGDKLGAYSEFRLVTWNIQSATIRPIPGTRMNGIYTANSYGGFLHLIQGLKNLTMDGGSSDKYPGLSAFPASRVFMYGSFGISSTHNGVYSGYHEYSLSVTDGGSITMRNCEGDGGFSSIRLQGGNIDMKVKVLIELCYVHGTVSEGSYIGFTHAPPGAKIQDLIMRNCIYARTGSEAIQMQHLIGNAHIHNLTLHNPDASWLSQFMPGQDTGIQLSADEGNNVIENIILDSWGSNGLNLFGSSVYPAGDSSRTRIRNVLFNDGRGPGIYIHNSTKYKMKWELTDLYFRKPNYDYFKINKSPAPKHIISAHNGSDSIWFDRITYSANDIGVLPTLYQSTSKLIIGSSTIDNTLPAPEFVNSGFHEPASKIKTWFPLIIGYIAGNTITPTHWDQGDIAIDQNVGSRPLFFKARVTHDASIVRPRDNPDQWFKLTWDEKGIRNDRPEHSAGDTQSTYPPDDFRIKAGSFWALKNMGFIQEINKDQLITELQKQVYDLTSQINECISRKTYEEGKKEVTDKVLQAITND